MYLRELPVFDVGELRDTLRAEAATEVISTDTTKIRVALTGENEGIWVDGTQFAPTDQGLEALGHWLQVPTPFQQRLDSVIEEILLNHLLRAKPGEVELGVDAHGIREVNDPGRQVVPLWRYAEVMANILSSDGQVVGLVNTPKLFRLDAVVPQDFDRGVGGDPKVGDISLGGVTIEQNRRANLAPVLGSFGYRLECTNGLVARTVADKVPIHGQTVDEVIKEVELTARRLFERSEMLMRSHYDLRTVPVDNPERTLLAIADEAGLSPRLQTSLASHAPLIATGDDGASMFDIVNLISNHANEPSVIGRPGQMRKLELTAGMIAWEHGERCPSCQHKLN